MPIHYIVDIPRYFEARYRIQAQPSRGRFYAGRYGLLERRIYKDLTKQQLTRIISIGNIIRERKQVM